MQWKETYKHKAQTNTADLNTRATPIKTHNENNQKTKPTTKKHIKSRENNATNKTHI